MGILIHHRVPKEKKKIGVKLSDKFACELLILSPWRSHTNKQKNVQCEKLNKNSVRS